MYFLKILKLLMSLDFGVREFGVSPVSKVNDAVRV